MQQNQRVRFAPSPSGYLHVGGARTALFNWLWARKHKGTFVLRIEDTDQKRSTAESKQVILDSMQWLGMGDWDEGPGVGGKFGPYEQSARLDIYKHFTDKLIDTGKAYRCYCTEEELNVYRDQLKAKREAGDKGAFFKYPRTCRERTDHPDKPFVVRFKAPTTGQVEYVDRVFGKMVSSNKENQDFVIMRSDGLPIYSWACVIDDYTMGITLVARAADHIVNTPPQILLYNALDVQHPEFAHLPLMRSMENEKLSKRHGSVSVAEYRDKGYSPYALLSYISRFGWGHKDKELFTIQELIDGFDFEGCGKSDGKFDFKKLAAANFDYLKSPALTSDPQYAQHLLPFLSSRGFNNLDPNIIQTLIPLVRPRSKTFVEAANELDPILRTEITIDQAAAEKLLTTQAKTHLRNYTTFLSSVDRWTEEALRSSTASWLTESQLTMKDIGQPVRLSIVGRTNSPELFQVMSALGKEVVIDRIRRCI